jgi:hypothetical protein
MPRKARRSHDPADLRRGFAYGLVAGGLLWTGLDGTLPHAFERTVRLPAGPVGDALALAVIVAWAILILAVARSGLTGKPLLRRHAPPSRPPQRRSGKHPLPRAGRAEDAGK